MQIVKEFEELVEKERKISADVVRKLAEIYTTQAYLKAGCTTIQQFCIKWGKYSEPAANRRIAAMRLLLDHKQVAEKIETGELNLTNAAMVQSVLRKARENQIELPKEEIFQAALGSSTRQAEKAIFENAAEHGLDVNSRARELKEKLAKLRSLLSHKLPNLSEEELLHYLADDVLARLDPSQKKSSLEARARNPDARYIPAQLKRAIYLRDGGRCRHIDPKTKQRCDATHFLHYDHIHPRSKGGLTTAGNLQLLCQFHNHEKGNHAQRGA